MISKYLKLYLLALLSTVLCSAALAADALEIDSPWIREAPPTSKVLAAYMTIHNPGKQAVTITGVSSPDFETVQLHRTVIEEGVARMLHIERLEVPANETLQLEPGGLHLMLFNPERALAEGQSTRLNLHLENETCVRLTVPVLRKAGGGHQHHHH